jgi:hypothetical protein
MAERSDLPARAQKLLSELRGGTNVAEPRHYLAAEGYRHLARATLDNAVALCTTNSCDDFRIFSALYAVRHGIELWLKAFIVDFEIDRMLRRVAAGNTFEELKETAESDRDTRDARRRARRGLKRSLCQFRNLSLGMRHPDFRKHEIKEEFCGDAMARLRAKADGSRSEFAYVWAIPVTGHDLLDLWARARMRFADVTFNARIHNQQCLGAEILTEEQVTSACELFGAVDPNGDAFRYPSGMSGDLHRMESISLEALGRFASVLANTVVVYGGVISDGYVDSTIGRPLPSTAAGF